MLALPVCMYRGVCGPSRCASPVTACAKYIQKCLAPEYTSLPSLL